MLPARLDGEPDGGGLFRNQVMVEQQSMWLGTVMLASRRSHVAMAMFALAAVGLLGMLLCASYTRTVRVGGLLVSEPGLVRMFAPQQGVLVRIDVHEGDRVVQGASLLVLSTDLQTEALGDTSEEVVRRLRSRRESMVSVRRGQQKLQARQEESLQEQLEAVESARNHLDRELILASSRLALARQRVQRQEQLYASRVTSVQVRDQAQDNALRQEADQQSLERERAVLAREHAGLVADLASLPLRNAAELAETDRTIAALDQEIAETEARRQIVVTAPQDGIVSSVQAEVGSSVGMSVPLLSIIPAGSTLRAELFAPSRAIGFVTPGQSVLLRYEAFPYQKFGRYEGQVVRVSHTSVSAAELPQQLSGLNTLYDGTAPIYRITVALARQEANAYGRPVALQPGMQLEADVLVEKRRLIEWVFDPLYTLTGRMQG